MRTFQRSSKDPFKDLIKIFARILEDWQSCVGDVSAVHLWLFLHPVKTIEGGSSHSASQCLASVVHCPTCRSTLWLIALVGLDLLPYPLLSVVWFFISTHGQKYMYYTQYSCQTFIMPKRINFGMLALIPIVNLKGKPKKQLLSCKISKFRENWNLCINLMKKNKLKEKEN